MYQLAITTPTSIYRKLVHIIKHNFVLFYHYNVLQVLLHLFQAIHSCPS